MPRKAAELSPLSISRLKDPGLWAVGGVSGLYLHVNARGARSWILRVVVGVDFHAKLTHHFHRILTHPGS